MKTSRLAAGLALVTLTACLTTPDRGEAPDPQRAALMARVLGDAMRRHDGLAEERAVMLEMVETAHASPPERSTAFRSWYWRGPRWTFQLSSADDPETAPPPAEAVEAVGAQIMDATGQPHKRLAVTSDRTAFTWLGGTQVDALLHLGKPLRRRTDVKAVARRIVEAEADFVRSPMQVPRLLAAIEARPGTDDPGSVSFLWEGGGLDLRVDCAYTGPTRAQQLRDASLAPAYYLNAVRLRVHGADGTLLRQLDLRAGERAEIVFGPTPLAGAGAAGRTEDSNRSAT